MNKQRKSRNALGTAKALFLDQRGRKWQRTPLIRRHKERFIADRPAGMSRSAATKHWEHIFAGYRDSPHAAHWAETAVKVVGGQTPRQTSG